MGWDQPAERTEVGQDLTAKSSSGIQRGVDFEA